jgi:hypothetical protein
MNLPDVSKKEIPKEIHRGIWDTIPIHIHNGKVLPVRILRKNLQSIISVCKSRAGNLSLPVHGKVFFVRQFRAVRKIIAGFRTLIPEFFGRINNFLPGFCNNNADIYCGAAIFNNFKCNIIAG